MNDWDYAICDKETGCVLMSASGFESEADATLQAEMDAKAENLKNFYIQTFQNWNDWD